MEDIIHKTDLLNLLINRIPEKRTEFMILPQETSIYVTLTMLCDVTAELAHQHKFRAVKRCLLTAEDVLLAGDKQVSNAVCSVYILRLAMLMDKHDADSEIIHHLLPRAIRAEYRRQLNTGRP